MNTQSIPWKHVRNVLVLFAPLWGGAMFLFGGFGAAYSVLRDDVYSARQPLVVRDEATNSYDRLGRFSNQTDLKAAQETVLEMARNPEVVAAALRKIGPENGKPDPHWPSTNVVDSTADADVNVVAPQGSEFGSTDVVYLQVHASSQERASQFCSAMQESLSEQLRHVRRVRADSVIEELTFARDLASRNLDQASHRIREIEIQFGADLGDLRSLNDAISGDGAGRRTLAQTVNELQAAELALEELQSLNALLIAGASNPQHLLISGSKLLESQPSLSRLKAGLIDAQIAASQLSGVYSDQHPRVRSAIAAEQEIRLRMQLETKAAIEASEPKLELQRNRVKHLRDRAASLRKRLDQLAVVRSDYAKLDADMKHRTSALAQAEQSLAEATATRSAALSTNLVSPLGPPQMNDQPMGPGGFTITLGCTMAGLIFGLGGVFLIAPGPTQAQGGRRWSDYLGAGRRQSDQAAAAQPDLRNHQRVGSRASDRAAMPDRRDPWSDLSNTQTISAQIEQESTDSLQLSAPTGADEISESKS